MAKHPSPVRVSRPQPHRRGIQPVIIQNRPANKPHIDGPPSPPRGEAHGALQRVKLDGYQVVISDHEVEQQDYLKRARYVDARYG
jgi:hypothetical protein